jgi:hypothetical protein
MRLAKKRKKVSYINCYDACVRIVTLGQNFRLTPMKGAEIVAGEQPGEFVVRLRES